MELTCEDVSRVDEQVWIDQVDSIQREANSCSVGDTDVEHDDKQGYQTEVCGTAVHNYVVETLCEERESVES